MTVKETKAYEAHGRLFTNEEAAVAYSAKTALEKAFTEENQIGITYAGYTLPRYLKMMENPQKVYQILKEFYGDR